MRRTIPALLAGIVLALAGAAVTLAGSGTGASVRAVEGRPFSGTVASIASTATANERFVAQLYLDLLGRPVDHGGLNGYAQFLASGGTRTQVAQSVAQSQEYREGLVRSVYSSFLHRAPSPTDLATGASFLGSATDEAFKSSVLGSDEYFANRGGSTVTGFLTALYNDVLVRPIDPSSLETLTAALVGGATRGQVATVVLTSQEGRSDVVNAWFQQYLHRTPGPTELTTFVDLLTTDSTDETVIAAVVGSPEYFADVPASFASASIDWGDRSAPSTGTVVGSTAVTGTHTYAEEGPYTFTVTVHDLDGTFTVPGTAAVADAPLVAAPVAFPVLKKTTFTRVVATFSDGNPGAAASDFTATIAWGDGASSAGAVATAPGGGFAVAGTHGYKKKGLYSVAIHVADAGGATAATTSSIVVGRR